MPITHRLLLLAKTEIRASRLGDVDDDDDLHAILFIIFIH